MLRFTRGNQRRNFERLDEIYDCFVFWLFFGVRFAAPNLRPRGRPLTVSGRPFWCISWAVFWPPFGAGFWVRPGTAGQCGVALAPFFIVQPLNATERWRRGMHLYVRSRSGVLRSFMRMKIFVPVALVVSA